MFRLSLFFTLAIALACVACLIGGVSGELVVRPNSECFSTCGMTCSSDKECRVDNNPGTTSCSCRTKTSSAGTIVGIVFGVLFGIGAVIAVIVFVARRNGSCAVGGRCAGCACCACCTVPYLVGGSMFGMSTPPPNQISPTGEFKGTYSVASTGPITVAVQPQSHHPPQAVQMLQQPMQQPMPMPPPQYAQPHYVGQPRPQYAPGPGGYGAPAPAAAYGYPQLHPQQQPNVYGAQYAPPYANMQQPQQMAPQPQYHPMGVPLAMQQAAAAQQQQQQRMGGFSGTPVQYAHVVSVPVMAVAANGGSQHSMVGAGANTTMTMTPVSDDVYGGGGVEGFKHIDTTLTDVKPGYEAQMQQPMPVAQPYRPPYQPVAYPPQYSGVPVAMPSVPPPSYG